MLRYRKFLLALAFMMATPGVVLAQATDTKPSQPEQALLKPEQLDALVAPIALYPDALLANLLAASTYPLEVVQADRWLQGKHAPRTASLSRARVAAKGYDSWIKRPGRLRVFRPAASIPRARARADGSEDDLRCARTHRQAMLWDRCR